MQKIFLLVVMSICLCGFSYGQGISYNSPSSGWWANASGTVLSWNIEDSNMSWGTAGIIIAGDSDFAGLAYTHSIAIESDTYPFAMEVHPNLTTNQLYYRRILGTDLSGNVYTGETMTFTLDTVFPTIDYTSPSTFYLGDNITVSASVFDTHLVSGGLHTLVWSSVNMTHIGMVDILWHGGITPLDSTSPVLLGPLNLWTGTYYRYVIATDAAGNETVWTMQSFTVLEQEQEEEQTPSGNGGGWSARASVDTCPYGDYSASYYDNDCGQGTGHIMAISNALINKRSSRSDEAIQTMLDRLIVFNNLIQTKESIASNTKSLFQWIIDALIAHFRA